MRHRLGALALLPLLACVEVTAPGAPDITIEQTGGSGTGTCECDATALGERVFRFTRLEIDEPEALASTLNSMWAGELAGNSLNVLFHVLEAEAGTGVAFESIRLAAGPGWHSPTTTAPLTDEEIDSYCLLPDMEVEIEMEPYHGYQCVFKSAQSTSLLFHLGPQTEPMVCSPLLDAPNTTPIKDLKVRFGFNEDCTAIEDGFLDGCILEAEAQRICMCLIAGTCPTPEAPETPFDPDDLSGYCGDACGGGWISFGSIIKSFGLRQSCVDADGRQGFRLQAFFDAEDVGARFNPVASADCSE